MREIREMGEMEGENKVDMWEFEKERRGEGEEEDMHGMKR